MRRGLLLAAVFVLGGGVGGVAVAQIDDGQRELGHYEVQVGDLSAMAIARRLCGPDAPASLGAQIHALNRDLFDVLNVGEALHIPAGLPGDCPEVTTSTTALPTTDAPATTSTSPPATTTTAPATTTTTTLPAATTSTVAPTTTEPPATTSTAAATTTSTQPPTTSSAPPSGASFAEDFATPEGFYDRFDYGWSGGEVVGTSGELQPYHGDHDEDCHGPDTQREITYGPGVGAITPTNPGKAGMFWWCAPGGDPAKGHMMTGLNTLGYTIIYFSPKRTFTDVTRVCWDQNTTSMDSHWTNVVIAPLSDVAREQAESESGAEANRGDGDLGFDDPEFQATNGPTTFVVARDGMGVKVTRNRLDLWEGDHFVDQQFYGWVDNFDKATRYRHCMTDTAAGVTLTAAEPNGATRTRTFPGVDFPAGPVRVVFEDANYDAPKRDGYDPAVLTWHWDNIVVEAS